MSNPLRIGLVAEGPTDGIVIEAALRSILEQRTFILVQLQPEGSLAFGETGTGWTGVYRWCKQAVARGLGRLRDDALLFEQYDALILHLDADVAGCEYADGSLNQEEGDAHLPCEKPCPPASATTDELRSVLCSWCREPQEPARTVICTPSKSTDAWVLAALFPDDQAMAKGIECFGDPESRLRQQPKGRRIRKTQSAYRDRSQDLGAAWPRIASSKGLTEAHRFEVEVLAVLSALMRETS